MPTGTRVDRCFQKLKGRVGINAAAVCTASTGEVLKTGKPVKHRDRPLYMIGSDEPINRPHNHCACGGKCAECKDEAMSRHTFADDDEIAIVDDRHERPKLPVPGADDNELEAFCSRTGKPGICEGQRAGSGLHPLHALRSTGYGKGTTQRSSINVIQTARNARVARKLGVPGQFGVAHTDKPKKFCQETKRPGPCKGQKRGTSASAHHAAQAGQHRQAAGFLRQLQAEHTKAGNHGAAMRADREAAGHELDANRHDQHAKHAGRRERIGAARKPAASAPAARKPLLSTSRAGKKRIAEAKKANSSAPRGNQAIGQRNLGKKTFKVAGHIVKAGTPGSKKIGSRSGNRWATTSHAPDEIKGKRHLKDEITPGRLQPGRARHAGLQGNQRRGDEKLARTRDAGQNFGKALPIPSRAAPTGTVASRSASRRAGRGFAEFSENMLIAVEF